MYQEVLGWGRPDAKNMINGGVELKHQRGVGMGGAALGEGRRHVMQYYLIFEHALQEGASIRRNLAQEFEEAGELEVVSIVVGIEMACVMTSCSWVWSHHTSSPCLELNFVCTCTMDALITMVTCRPYSSAKPFKKKSSR